MTNDEIKENEAKGAASGELSGSFDASESGSDVDAEAQSLGVSVHTM